MRKSCIPDSDDLQQKAIAQCTGSLSLLKIGQKKIVVSHLLKIIRKTSEVYGKKAHL
ncbi:MULTISPECIES: hypothetical protein [Okeania]|uniref:hypothetical protein n=1 Tax=Okeania TaxID=1458928 RepID=UPI001374D25A|nr:MULTISPECIES: hypothetical protein [Okeania]NET12947.1 hypothetical protein [Okeania sp. SIO1H6]NET22540.1 hypothetical protein [Okeania sp. SIO1H5]NET79477.1 hypothetical protein [Okeania sp. SIO1F9]NET95665.1 hypothetical protein [Okeania sp. SIO1H2]